MAIMFVHIKCISHKTFGNHRCSNFVITKTDLKRFFFNFPLLSLDPQARFFAKKINKKCCVVSLLFPDFLPSSLAFVSIFRGVHNFDFLFRDV